MIRRRDDSTIVIPQTAHGWLAGQLAAQWGNTRFRLATLPNEVRLAAANHDLVWFDWERSPSLNADRRPIDFMEMPIRVHLPIWQDSINGMAAQSRYAGLLVSMHAAALVDMRLKRNPSDSIEARDELHAFCQAQQTWQAEQREALAHVPHFAPGLSPAALADNLRLLQVFDWLSLLLCMDTVIETTIPDVPTAPGQPRATLRMRADGPHRLSLSPWPFARPTFSATVQFIQLPAETFADNPALRQVWQSLTPQTRQFQFIDSEISQ